MTTSNEHNNAPAVRFSQEQIRALAICLESCRVSISEVQRKLQISFNEANDLCQSLVDAGYATGLALAPSLRATPAPAPEQGEPFGYFRAEPFGWTDCSEDAEGAIALYEHSAHEKHWTENEPVRLPSARTDRVYLAGPMTGIAELNFPAFNQEAERLRAEGLQVLNPADHGIVDGADWADYLRHDIAGLASCERIHLLRGWTKSKGACLEMTIAKALGMTVTYQVDAEMEHNNAPVQEGPSRDDETTAFERWLERTSPSGDVEQVHRQWLASSDYEDLFAKPAQEPMTTAEVSARYRFLMALLLDRGVLTDRRYSNGTWSLQGIALVDDSGLRGAGRTPEEAIDNAIEMARLNPNDQLTKWRETHEQIAQEVTLTDEAVNDAAKVLAERFDYPWEHMPEEGRKNMRVQARAVVEAAFRAKGAA